MVNLIGVASSDWHSRNVATPIKTAN